ncbi:hypothetical protein CH63R_07133 [Colletotrichum higginsianum IMI 349063]|uniref:Uncharacterized protein n=1 Tax=Colletotrichum higginsianum (strain IMI 349063) TaxID=759273 RepID=A0A1B7Y8Y7_COLHI|nr:hypothetical protein CH63R_07133 [Colletotrichum higginsianum IMI 349063]OBR08368.1 hypothetical protein CH63R_07133 [Colletotrichum higginsianum IMI 349063]
MGRVRFDRILPPSVLAPIHLHKGCRCAVQLPEATESPSSPRQSWPTATHLTVPQTLLLPPNGAAAPRLLCSRVEHAKRVVVRLNQVHQRRGKRPDRHDVYNIPRRERRRSVAELDVNAEDFGRNLLPNRSIGQGSS